MKRTPLRRKTPLKRTGIKRKSSTKGKSQSYFKRKVVERFMAGYRGRPCAVCGKTQGTCAHHVVSKGSCPHHIATENMVITLCPKHHRWAHGDRIYNGDAYAIMGFLMWLLRNRPEQYTWCMAHRHDTAATCGRIDWKARWEVGE